MATFDLSDASGSYYEATADRDPLGPPLAGRIKVDIGVVGGGYAGLSAALELAQRGYSVAVLEARRVGWGASGRNGGQVLVGYAGQEAIERQFGAADAKRAWDLSVEAVDLVRERIGRHGIECDFVDGHITLASTGRKGAALMRWAEHLSDAYGYAVRAIGPTEIGDWVASRRYVSGAYDARSGHFHPLRFCLGLAKAARSAGAQIFEGAAVRQLQSKGRIVLGTSNGEVECDFAVLAGNAYLGAYGDIAPPLMRRILAVGTYVVATKTMDPERASALVRHRAAAADTNFILDYFRVTADHRLLFGGADVFTGSTRADVAKVVRGRMLHVFPQLADLDIAYSWSGIVDATINNAPDFGRLALNIYYLQGFSGHGVALANLAGRLVAEAIAGQAERFDALARLRHWEFPRHEGARRTAISLGVLFNRIRDAL